MDEEDGKAAEILVREAGCTCKRRWFACTCPVGILATYTGPGIDGIPTKAFVALVREYHPKEDLIYIGAAS